MRPVYLVLVFFMFYLGILASGFTQETSSKENNPDKQILIWKIPGSGQKALIPDISLIGSFAGAYFRDDPVGDQGENPSRTGLNFQGAELGLQSVVDPYIRADIFILFLEDAIEVEDATITTLSLPFNLQIRAGKMLPRFGRQLTQHLEQINFVDYSGMHRYFFGSDGFSELGVELSALLPLPWFSEISLEFLQGENDTNFNGSAKGDFAYLAHFKNAFDLSQNLTLQSGLSSVLGHNATSPGNWTQVYAADLYLRWKPSANRGLKWQTEYFYRRLQDIDTTQVEGGFDTQVIYQFARRFEGGLRFDGIGFPKDSFRQLSLSPVVTFLASEFFRLRAQYSLVHTVHTDKEQHEAFLQLQFNMGPHGAHQF